MADKLTIKQEKFAQGLFAGLSQREAYKQAYPCKNMSDTVIDVKASELSKNGKVMVRLNELINELKERNMVTIERVLAEYAKIGFSNIADYLKVDDFEVTVGRNEEGEPIKRTIRGVEIFKTGEIDKDKLCAVAEIRETKEGISLKLHDKKGALDSMGKHLGMFTDKVELTGKGGGPIQYEDMTPEQRRARINELITKRGIGTTGTPDN